MAQEKMGQLGILRRFFGMLPGQALLAFKGEIDQLSADEKLELAQLAAKQMGLTADQVSFPLT